jgi:hypothetical protein
LRPRHRLLSPLVAVGVIALLLTGCGSGDGWSRPHAVPTAVGPLGPGFSDPARPPAPEATITPSPGSWNEVHPSKGYRVVLLTTGTDHPTQALVTAVTAWADDEDVDLRTVVAVAPHDLLPSIGRAVAMKPDLIVSAGNDLVDPLTVVTASHLDQQFLAVGAELPEPTHNVTSVDWSGASFRGEGLGASSTYDPGSFTAERSEAAVRAGVAAVLHDLTGIVIWLK